MYIKHNKNRRPPVPDDRLPMKKLKDYTLNITNYWIFLNAFGSSSPNGSLSIFLTV